MGYTTPTKSEVVSAKRMMVMGAPNTFKTSAICQTWPRPLHIQVYPGEKGNATIPLGVEGVIPYVWQDDPITKMSSSAVVAAVETLTFEILGAKHGEIRSFSGDGIHKYYAYILDWVTGGAFFRGEEFEPRLYSKSHEHFRFYIQRVMASPVEYVVFTCWDGREADDPGTKGGPSHIYPDLPGKMAKSIMGEFGIVVYSTADWAGRQPGKLAKGEWQLLPEGKVWGAAVKAPVEVVQRLPVKVPQSLPVLEQTLAGAWAASQASKEAK